MLNLDFWSILFTVINLLCFFLIIKFFLLKPVKKVMDERQRLVNGEIENAEKTKKEAEELKAEYEDDLKNAKEEARKIKSDAKIAARSEYDKILASASASADTIITEAKEKASKEHDKAMEELYAEIISLAMTAATKVVKSGMSYEDLNSEGGSDE